MAPELDALLRAARRRIVRQTWARQLGEAVRIVLGLAVVLVGADRLWRLPFSPWPLVGVILLLAGGLAGLVAWRRRLGAQATAWVLDERLGLGERLSSAVAMRQSGYQGPLLEPVVGAAEREAAAIDLRVALPEPARGRLRQSVGLGLLLLTVALLPRQTFWRSRTDLATEAVTLQLGQELRAVAQAVETRGAQAPRARAQARALLREALRLRRARLSKAEALRRLERRSVALQREREWLAGRPLRQSGRAARRELSRLGGVAAEIGRELADPRPQAAAEWLREQAHRARQGLSKTEREALAEELEQAAQALTGSPYESQREALNRAAEALRQGSGEAAARAIERAADSLEQSPSPENELLEEMQERVENAKEAVGEAESLVEPGGSCPGGLTDRGAGRGGLDDSDAGRAGRGRGPGSTDRAAEPAPGEDAPPAPPRPGDSPDGPDQRRDSLLYAPRRSETLQQDARLGGRLNAGGRVRTEQDRRAAPRLNDAQVPYYEVLPEYSAAAEQAVSRSDIPLTERHRVKRYFEELRAPTTP